MKTLLSLVLCCILFCSCSSKQLLGQWEINEKSEVVGNLTFTTRLILEKENKWTKIKFKGLSGEYSSFGHYEIKGDSLILYMDGSSHKLINNRKETERNKFVCTAKTLLLLNSAGSFSYSKIEE